MQLRRTSAALAVALAAGFAGGPAAHAASLPLPNSMASAGDSMTRAFDVATSCTLIDCPQYSWSTGTNSAVDSQYQRILAANSAIAGHENNDAATGAKMSQLDGQLKNAALQAVQYVTVEMGANDVCASSTAKMTSTANYQSEFQQAMSDFTAADPTGHVMVYSIVNVNQLWQLEHSNPSAVNAWKTYNICPDVLLGTDADRQAAATQEQADNNALATVCAQFTQCQYDNGALYNTAFAADDVSTVDYFHPNVNGQNLLASTTWSNGYWPNTP